MAEQFVAHLRPTGAFLAQSEPAAWLWRKLRELSPLALAVVLMPTHLHLLVPDRSLSLDRFRRLLVAFGARFRLHSPWLPIGPPRSYPTRDKVLRQIRYIHLNPCRPSRIGTADVRLVADPLLWEWSTHRDLVGAVADPWVTPARLGPLARPDAGWWHGYVSSDPSVHVQGTPRPEPASACTVPTVPLDRILRAAAAATRSGSDGVRRRGACRNAFFDLAFDQGWTRSGQLAEIAGTTTEAVRARKGRSDASLLAVSRLCLGDDRLLVRTSYEPPPGLGASRLALWQR
jgi:hypothetical protein